MLTVSVLNFELSLSILFEPIPNLTLQAYLRPSDPMQHVWFTLVESDKKAKLIRFDICPLFLEVNFVCDCFYKIIRVVKLIV